MGFILYDLIFLAAFTLFVIIFLYTRKHNLKREGLLYLYRTRWGIRFIEWTTKRYPNLLTKLQYPVLFCGYLLMIFGIWFIISVAYHYITSPYIAQALKVPVVMPLIPYLPDIFNIDFLPPFYFTYWIIIIAIIAIPHEFAHGIFARLNKIRILSTGFGFLGPFLAAFVEQDDKQMQKSKKFAQLSVLAAGTFANVVVTIFFALVLMFFFMAAFTPAGVNFNMYAAEPVNVSQISLIDDNQTSLNLTKITANNQTYLVDSLMIEQAIENNEGYILGFLDSPALNAEIVGAITHIDGEKIASYKDLNRSLSSKSPGDNITITTKLDNEIKHYDITLAERDGKSFLGIAFVPYQGTGLVSHIYLVLSEFRDPFIYYESDLGDFGIFIRDLLWWIVVISLSVALINMLPLGIFDGGRYFFLTIWGLTGSRKAGEIAFRISTWLLLLIIALMLVKWLFVFAL